MRVCGSEREAGTKVVEAGVLKRIAALLPSRIAKSLLYMAVYAVIASSKSDAGSCGSKKRPPMEVSDIR